MRRIVWLLLGLSAYSLLGIQFGAAQAAQTINGPRTPIPPVFFGMTINGILRGTPWPAVPFGSMRLWDVSAWAQANPGRGVYNWTELDRIVSLANEHGVSDILFTFGKIPSWASRTPASGCGGLGGAPIQISEIVRKAGTVTVTTVTDHRRKVGDPVGIEGDGSERFGGGFVISAIPGPRTIVYRDERPDAQAGDGKVYGFGGCTSGLANPEDVIPFAKALTQRYCGKIKNYELWNEPAMVSFTETPGQLASIDRELYKVIKDPENCSCASGECSAGLSDGRNPNNVIAPANSSIATEHLAWLKRYASAPVHESSDVLAYHGYGYSQHPEHLIAGVNRVRSASGDGRMPVWDTESSWGKPTDLSEESKPGFITRFYLMHWLSGTSRFYWYAYDNPNLGILWTPSQGLNAEGVAYRETYKWLVGAVVNRCLVSDDRVSCSLSRPTASGYSAQILWSSTSGFDYKVPSGFSQYRTLDGTIHSVTAGQTISITAPVLLETGLPD